MNIVHINQSDIAGGAAIAAYRLHQGLLAQDVDSRLLVGAVHTDSECIAEVPRRPFLERQIARITWRLGLNYLHLANTFDLRRHRFYQQADILNFHNLHMGYFNYLAIPSLTQKTPALFTLHDMWSFTGHCAYSYDCDRWKTGCGHCPYPHIYPPIHRDNTRLEWKLKNWLYARSNLTIVTVSHWLTRQVKQSMLQRFQIHYIPYGLDVNVYRPLEQQQCRYVLGIPHDKRVLLLVAENIKDFRKGGDLLVNALQLLPDSLKKDLLLLTMGSDGKHLSQNIENIDAMHFGYINLEQIKVALYSAADITVFPTRADNLPLVLQESMACGTPMISFNVGGVPDLVRPGITGYVAQPEDAQDLSDKIIQFLEEQQLHDAMSQQCRAIALEEFSLELQVQRYLTVYQQILSS